MQNKPIFTLKKNYYSVCELPCEPAKCELQNITCQTTGCCVQCLAWNKTPDCGSALHVYSLQSLKLIKIWLVRSLTPKSNQYKNGIKFNKASCTSCKPIYWVTIYSVHEHSKIQTVSCLEIYNALKLVDKLKWYYSKYKGKEGASTSSKVKDSTPSKQSLSWLPRERGKGLSSLVERKVLLAGWRFNCMIWKQISTSWRIER